MTPDLLLMHAASRAQSLLDRPWYDVTDDLGNWAEAQGIAAARVAAVTLIEDGADRAEIRRADIKGPPVEWADRDPYGHPQIHTTTIVRED